MSDPVSTELPPVFEGLKIVGGVVNEIDHLYDYISSSIRRGHPQVKMQASQPHKIALVCGGPSLEATLPELRDLIAEGAKVATVNGAYAWCIDHNIIPSIQVVMDARAFNSRFVDPPLPRCHYAIASQAHPETWDAVKDRSNVWIWHCGFSEGDPTFELVNHYYRGNWHLIAGGITVGTRAISVLRTLGYLRFDIFGMDSCVIGDQHHGYTQPENDGDRVYGLKVSPIDRPDLVHRFRVTGWHVQQADDMLQFIRHNGDKFVLSFHGGGLLAHLMEYADPTQLQLTQE
jgi:hypothetical protein